MKRNIFRFFLSAVLLMCCTVASAVGTQPAGAGTTNNPYQIATKDNLLWFADHVNQGNTTACAELTADITVNTGVLNSGNLNGDGSGFSTWTPIGGFNANGKDYSGEFNGNGHTISGLYFNDETAGNVGVFGKTASGAYIHDLGIKDSYFNGGHHVGGICGDFAYGKIENCWNGATVRAKQWNAGGISGSCYKYASIKFCYNIGKILPCDGGNQSYGGICGAVYENTAVDYTISNCYTLEGKCDRGVYGSLDGGCPASKINNSFVKGATAFASGEVCWTLNGSKLSANWRQQLETDDYPTLSSTYLVNYTDEKNYYNLISTQVILYTSTDGQVVTPYVPSVFGATIVSNTYEGGVGVIIFDKDVTSIGSSAFIYCTSLQSVIIPDSVTSIGSKAFYNCTSLQSVIIPNSVTSIGSYAFYYCELLQSVAIPNSVTSIGSYAFYYCTSLQSVAIPNGVTSIGSYAFHFCTSLQSVAIPNSVTSIGSNAFSYCKLLPSVTIPNSVTSIGSSAFFACYLLQSVTFHALPNVDESAFLYCDEQSTKILDLTDSDKPYIGTSTANYPGFTEAHYHRTLEKGKWGTIILPFAPTDGLEGLEFYELKEMTTESGGSLVFTKVNAPQGGVPYLFRNVSDSETDFTLTANTPNVTVETQGQTVGAFTLKGSFKAVSLNTKDEPNGNLYYLKDDEFWHATGKINIAPFRAYIEGNGSAHAKSFMLVVSDNGDNVTAVPGIMDENGDIDETEAIYDLNGRKLSAPVKGQVNIIRTKSGKTIKRMF